MAVDTLPYLQTERLVIRLLEKNEAESVVNYYKKNREHLAPFQPEYPPDFFTVDFWRKQIVRNIDEFYTDLSVRLFVFEKTSDPRSAGTLIGSIGFGGILRNAAQFCYLGYGLDEDKQGLGYMGEALRPSIQYMFDSHHIHRIMANYIPTNERSGRLLRRLGFVVEGYARDYLFLNGKWQDHILTSLTNPNWQPQ